MATHSNASNIPISYPAGQSARSSVSLPVSADCPELQSFKLHSHSLSQIRNHAQPAKDPYMRPIHPPHLFGLSVDHSRYRLRQAGLLETFSHQLEAPHLRKATDSSPMSEGLNSNSGPAKRSFPMIST